MFTNLLGLMPLSAWRCNATKFASFYDPLPMDELENAGFSMLVHFLAAGDSPILGKDKAVLPFAIPCLLKDAPYTVKTAAKVGQVSGKQRSAAHVTVASFLIIDVDGLSDEEFAQLLKRLRSAGLTFLCYSTHSHGREDKPGIRARMVVPIDRALPAAEYESAWLGFDILFCNGVIALQDASGKAMCQQQGVWGAHPDLIGLAFKITHKAGVASADALIAVAPVKKVVPKALAGRQDTPGLFDEAERRKVVAALSMLDPGHYETWVKTCACLVALRECLGTSARNLWLEFTDRAGEASKARNNQRCYDPEVMFDQITPSITPDIAMATLMCRAKETALIVAESEISTGTLTEFGHNAVKHLACYHRAALDILIKKYEVTL